MICDELSDSDKGVSKLKFCLSLEDYGIMEVKQSDCGKFQAVHYKEEKFQPHTNGCFPTVRPQTNWGILYYFVSLITLASLPLFLTLWFHGREFR